MAGDQRIDTRCEKCQVSAIILHIVSMVIAGDGKDDVLNAETLRATPQANLQLVTDASNKFTEPLQPQIADNGTFAARSKVRHA